jgi:hypothetical protein
MTWQAAEKLSRGHCEERFSRRGNLEVIDFVETEIAEFIPSHKARLLRLRLAMTARGSRKDGKKTFSATC